METVKLYKAGKVDADIAFPQSWNELHTAELEAIAMVMVSNITDLVQAKSIILLELLKYRSGLQKIPVTVIQLLDPEDLSRDGLPLVNFVYESNGLTNQPYKEIIIKKKVFAGPQNDFDTLTAGEFEAAEINFLQFKNHADPKHLAALAAILFRPAKVPFIQYNHKQNEYIVYDYEAQVTLFAALPPAKLFVVYIWYAGCRAMLPKYFPTMYEGDGAAAADTDLMVFTKCIHAAAGPKNGSREQVRRTLLKALYFEMEQEAVKAKEIKEMYDRN